jgi:hypothetical protein
MSVGDLVGVDGRKCLDVEDRSDGEACVWAEVLAHPCLRHGAVPLDASDVGRLPAGVGVHVERDRGHH